jgi:hypothetical protein
MSEEIKNEQVSEEVEQKEVEKTTEESKTFSQDEVNTLIAERLKREKKKYEDYGDLKTKATEYEKLIEERELAELNEKERLEKIAQKHEEEKQTLAQQLTDLQQAVQKERVTNEFIKVATSHNIAYIDDALKLADLSAVNVGEDGAIEGIEDVIKQLVDNKPFLLAQKKPQKPIGESHNGNKDTSDKTGEQLLKEAAEKYRQTGKHEDMVAYMKLKRELGV